MNRIAIFASGSGTNAENLIKFFANDPLNEIVIVCCNKANAGVLERSNKLNIRTFIFSKQDLTNGQVAEKLKSLQINFIILAGFLLQLPKTIIDAYPNQIVNIHPALLPKFGGKGMYGMHVHEAVVAQKESETGITIHYVNENYDEGAIIFQKSFEVLPTDTAEHVAEKIHDLEYTHFPQVIKKLLS